MSDINPPLPAEAAAWISRAYLRLEAQSGFRARDAQKQLSQEVAASLLTKTPLASEAPTGTGKTLAYLVGALAANHLDSVGVVVSTATKALQQQLLSTDLPRLVKAGLIREEQVALAKGRSNYLCLRDAHTAVASLHQMDLDPDFYAADDFVQLSSEEVEPLVSAYEAGRWNGDFDMYEGRRPKNVFPIAASADTCSNRRCEFFKDCAYFKARKELVDSKVVVVNHDLLLRDLLMTSQGLEPLLSLAHYHVVFDEAHHLPEKAIAVGSADFGLTALIQALPKLGGVQRLLSSSESLLSAFSRNLGVTEASFERVELMSCARALYEALLLLDVRDDSNVLRFGRGVLPLTVQVGLSALVEEAKKMVNVLTLVVDYAKTASSAGSDVASDSGTQAKLVELNRRVLDVKRPLDDLLAFDSLASSEQRKAVWMFRREGTTNLLTAPLEGADVLNKLLWSTDRVRGVAMVSATLRDLGGFERFKGRVGLPAGSFCTAMPYSFDYKASELRVASMSATPKFAERREYFKELRVKLPRYIEASEGTLLLFPSWVMLKEFTPLLRERFGERLRVQGDQVLRLLVRSHCQAIDAGKGSILAGVATLAEGLDLPGHYCTHVVIMALPFAVPSDPVEEELAELLGKEYFSQRSLPDSMVKLTQMVGRLLRRESDSGRITVFDRRLASTSYGQRMLRSLPPFTKVIEPLTSSA
jgi:ATP-dependent DNA helicase DinG